MITIELDLGQLTYSVKNIISLSSKNFKIQTECFDIESNASKYQITSYESALNTFLKRAKSHMSEEEYYNFLSQIFYCKDYSTILFSLEPFCDDIIKNCIVRDRKLLTFQKKQLFEDYEKYPESCHQIISRVFINNYVKFVLNSIPKNELKKLCHLVDSNALTDDMIVDFYYGNINKEDKIFNLAKFTLIGNIQSMSATIKRHLCFDCQNACISKCLKVSQSRKSIISEYIKDPGIGSGIQEVKANIPDEELIELIKSGKIISENDENAVKIGLSIELFTVSQCNNFVLDSGYRKIKK